MGLDVDPVNTVLVASGASTARLGSHAVTLGPSSQLPTLSSIAHLDSARKRWSRSVFTGKDFGVTFDLACLQAWQAKVLTSPGGRLLRADPLPPPAPVPEPKSWLLEDEEDAGILEDEEDAGMSDEDGAMLRKVDMGAIKRPGGDIFDYLPLQSGSQCVENRDLGFQRNLPVCRSPPKTRRPTFAPIVTRTADLYHKKKYSGLAIHATVSLTALPYVNLICCESTGC